jgi:hypothetical protein
MEQALLLMPILKRLMHCCSKDEMLDIGEESALLVLFV